MNVLCIYSKPPTPGKTKSRLAKAVGADCAAALSRAMIIDMCRMASKLEEAKIQLWHPPDSEPSEFSGVVSIDLVYHRQSGRNLGDRLSDTFRKLLSDRHERRVVVVGSDCCGLTPETIMEAFTALADHDVAIQRSSDGGYVMIGLSKWHSTLFSGISWGGHRVFDQTIAKIRSCGFRCKIFEDGFDIDTIEDVRRYHSMVSNTDYPETTSWLKANRNVFDQ